MEKGASSTLDYEKLNKDLGTSGTMGALGTLESEPASTGKGWEKYQQGNEFPEQVHLFVSQYCKTKTEFIYQIQHKFTFCM